MQLDIPVNVCKLLAGCRPCALARQTSLGGASDRLTVHLMDQTLVVELLQQLQRGESSSDVFQQHPAKSYKSLGNQHFTV